MSNLTLNTIEDITKAIETNKDNPMMLAVLNTLLKTKQNEIALLSKQNSTKKFTEDEQILKSVFVASRAYTHNKQSNSNKAYKAVITSLNIEVDKKLQESFFASSVLHCAKSNLNKSKDVYASLKSYKESVKQAKILLPLIEETTWQAWETAMYTIAKAIVKKAGKTWQDTDTDTEIVPAAADKKKVIITTRGKRK